MTILPSGKPLTWTIVKEAFFGPFEPWERRLYLQLIVFLALLAFLVWQVYAYARAIP